MHIPYVSLFFAPSVVAALISASNDLYIEALMHIGPNARTGGQYAYFIDEHNNLLDLAFSYDCVI
jgi:hypothetical protein